MVSITNFTPFANLRFSNFDADGREFGVFMIKTSMDIRQDGTCVLSSEQEPFAFTDEYHGELNASSVRYPSDFVPYKPRSEVILDATAYAPGETTAREWDVSVRVSDDKGVFVEKTLHITGPRQWQPEWFRALSANEEAEWQRFGKLFRGWKLSEADPISQLPIRYEYAFGGMIETGKNEDNEPFFTAYEHNPIGRGLIDNQHTDRRYPVPAPQIEDPLYPVITAGTCYSPQGLGPTPPAWLPRRALGGTYDQNWLDNVWPKWAKDYDFAFHNAAHPDLQGNRFLEGSLIVDLKHLHPTDPQFVIRIPASKPVVTAVLANGERVLLEMVRDTVFLEISDEFRHDPRVHCLWRTPFDLTVTEAISVRWEDDPTEPTLRLTPKEVAHDNEEHVELQEV